MDRKVYLSRAQVLCDWFDILRAAARHVDKSYEPVPVRHWMGGAEAIACLRSLGGRVRPAEPFYGWVLSEINKYGGSAVKDHAPELVGDGVSINDFHGLMTAEIGAETYFLLRADEQIRPMCVERALVVAGRSLEASLDLLARLEKAREKLFGDRVRHFGTELEPVVDRPVSEEDLILPDEFKRELLGYLDGFWKSAALFDRLRIAPTRGVLFVGKPGTGKSLTIRHLLGRYPECQAYVFVNECVSPNLDGSIFTHMLQRIAKEKKPTLVILEDLDRLFSTGAITREFFLNVLDGLFRPPCPVLWVATSNDPTELDQNLLNRPGRFDRVAVFQPPGQAERERLLLRYSPWPIENAEVLRDLARCATGLSGAHVREACCAAAMASTDDPAGYPKALLNELRRVQSQHEDARSYNFELDGESRKGFGNYV